MIKRFLCLILIAFIFCGLAACGPEENLVPPTPTEPPTTAIEPTETNEYGIAFNSATITKDWEGEDSLFVYLTWTNKTDRTTCFWTEMTAFAYQKDIELKTTFPDYYDPDFNLYENQDVGISPGDTIDLIVCFKLNDITTDVQVELKDFITLDQRAYKMIQLLEAING